MLGEELINRAREIGPLVGLEAENTDRNGRISDKVIDAFCDADLMQMMVPRALGGHEVSYGTMAAVVAEVGKYCTSTAWVMSFYLGHNLLHSLFPKQSQEEVFADRPYVLTAGTVAPNFRLTPVDGGYIASGRSQWNSGSAHAQWFLAAGLKTNGENSEGPLAFLVPASQVRKIDNWDVAGMRGTSSGDLEMEEVFVPAYHTVPVKDLVNGNSPGAKLHPNPMYSRPLIPFLLGETLPVVVAAYRGAANDFKALITDRHSVQIGSKVVDKQIAQIRVGQALAGAEVAEDLLRQYVKVLEETSVDDLKKIEQRANMRARAAMVTDYCYRGIHDLMLGAGGGAFRNESSLQRFFRDISVLRVHGFLDLDTATEAFGRIALGMDPKCPL